MKGAVRVLVFVAVLSLSVHAQDQAPPPPAGEAKPEGPAPAPPKPVDAAPQAAKPSEPQAPEARTDAQRLQELERRLDEQQKEIEALKAAKKPERPVDEKGAVAEAAENAPTFDWGFDDGFFVKGQLEGASYEVRPHVRLQLDYRAYPSASENLGEPHSVPDDQFLVRRARVGFMGNMGPFEFMLDVDPIRSPLPIADFWFQWHQWDEIQIRFGSFKAPFDIEDSQTSDLYIDNVERPLITGSGNQLAPDYRIGAEVFGKIAGGIFNYFASVVNQPDSNTVTGNDPLFTGRIETDVKGFELGAGLLGARVGVTGPKNTGNSFTGATPAQYVFFAPISVRGWEDAFVVDSAYYFGPVWAQGGFAWAQQERNRVGADGTSAPPLVTQGGWLTLGWLFFGPTTPGPHGVPFKDWNFLDSDLAKRRNGRNCGVELVVRVETIDIAQERGGRKFTSAAETTVATPSTATNALDVSGNQCQAITAGINFYPIDNVRFMFDYVHLRTGDRTRAEAAHSNQADEILVRAQLEF